MFNLEFLTKKQFFIIYGLFFCLLIFSLNGFLNGIVGFLALIVVFLSQYLLVKKYFFSKVSNQASCDLLSFGTVSSYYIVSLSILYYSVGISSVVLSLGLSISYLLSFLLFFNTFTVLDISLKKKFVSFYKSLNSFNSHDLIIIILSIYLLSNFFSNPVTNGSPTPWVNTTWLSFVIFFLISFFFIKKLIKGDSNILFISVLYLFIVISVIAIKYVLSFGYDTLLHQASLTYIDLNGRIEPLTPFYIGQYVLEVLVYKASGLSFVLIERWLGPLFFWFVSIILGFYSSKHLSPFKSFIGLVPLAVLLLLPSFFTYTSPFAFSLTWIFFATAALWFYISTGQKEYYYVALLASLSSFFIHPFVCLNFLVALFYAKLYTKKKVSIFGILFLIIGSALAVPIFFLVFHWLKGQIVFLKDPFYYLSYFLAMFGDPAWYSLTSYSLGTYLIYLFEKFHLILLYLFVMFWLLISKKNRKGNLFLFFLSLGVLLGSWIFVAAIEVDGYGYGDQINYAYRLMGVAQWFLWLILYQFLVSFFLWLKMRKKITIFFLTILFSGLLTISFYLTYPRNDEIARANVNNIRDIDYQALNYIYNREGGKSGYLVFANQIFGAAAIQKYGFSPYYQTSWGDVFYYSVPMSGEFNQRYEKIMNSSEFNRQLLDEAMFETGTTKAYFVITDYWPLNELSYKQMREQASDYYSIKEGKIEIFIFNYQY